MKRANRTEIVEAKLEELTNTILNGAKRSGLPLHGWAVTLASITMSVCAMILLFF